MRQLYDRGVRGFCSPMPQFIPRPPLHRTIASSCCGPSAAAGIGDIHWAAYIPATTSTRNIAELMVGTGMSYFEIASPPAARSWCGNMRMGYNLRVVLKNCRILCLQLDSGSSVLGELFPVSM